eukprot:354871-Chlamydomonas_euryale.AAC.2
MGVCNPNLLWDQIQMPPEGGSCASTLGFRDLHAAAAKLRTGSVAAAARGGSAVGRRRTGGGVRGGSAAGSAGAAANMNDDVGEERSSTGFWGKGWAPGLKTPRCWTPGTYLMLRLFVGGGGFRGMQGLFVGRWCGVLCAAPAMHIRNTLSGNATDGVQGLPSMPGLHLPGASLHPHAGDDHLDLSHFQAECESLLAAAMGDVLPGYSLGSAGGTDVADAWALLASPAPRPAPAAALMPAFGGSGAAVFGGGGGGAAPLAAALEARRAALLAREGAVHTCVGALEARVATLVQVGPGICSCVEMSAWAGLRQSVPCVEMCLPGQGSANRCALHAHAEQARPHRCARHTVVPRVSATRVRHTGAPHWCAQRAAEDVLFGPLQVRRTQERCTPAYAVASILNSKLWAYAVASILNSKIWHGAYTIMCTPPPFSKSGPSAWWSAHLKHRARTSCCRRWRCLHADSVYHVLPPMLSPPHTYTHAHAFHITIPLFCTV